MIKIMVDSSSDISKDDKRIDYFVPIAVNIDGKDYLDGIDLDKDTFYKLLTETSGFPSTSQPSPQTYIDIFEEVKAAGDELIYFALSSSLSGTYQGACLARDIVGYDKIYVIDTLTATRLIEMLVDYAVRLAKEGLTAECIAEKCEALKGKIHVFAGLETIEFLRRGGRLSNASAAVATLANIKPIITVTQTGYVEAIGKCLGKNKAIHSIADKLKHFEIDVDFPIWSLYTSGVESCEILEARLSDVGYSVEKRLQVGASIGTHIGPGVFGIVFVEK